MFKAASRVVSWNPGDYASNSASQYAWAQELISKLHLRGDEHILDVGCGDGKVTAELAGAVPRGSALGIDASAEMIGFARKTFPTSTISNLKFELLDARKIRFPQAFDLVFSNAALHWVDDHQAFLGGASGCLRSGGRLVVSCGGKGNAQDVFAALRAEMRSGRWREFFRRMDRPYFFYSPGDYGKWLASAGFESRAVRLTDKTMAFENRRQFAGWFRTTWLPYTQRVPEPVRGEFIAGIVDCYLASHPADAAGCIHVRMVRLEIDAVKV